MGHCMLATVTEFVSVSQEVDHKMVGTDLPHVHIELQTSQSPLVHHWTSKTASRTSICHDERCTSNLESHNVGIAVRTETVPRWHRHEVKHTLPQQRGRDYSGTITKEFKPHSLPHIAARTHTHTHTHTHTRIHTRHACAHAHTHTHDTHARMHTHTHTHTNAQHK